MSRGNRRGVLYKDHDDYLSFLMHISRTMERYPFKLHTLCLMTNHFHMLLETETDALHKIMQKLLHSYSMDFNRRHKYKGHVFESRYTDCLVEDERYFLEVSRYIHLNPVKALMVRSPLDYKYSSYDQFVSDKESGKKGIMEGLINPDRVLSSFGHNPKEQYRMFVEGKISHAEQELLIQKDVREDEMWLPW